MIPTTKITYTTTEEKIFSCFAPCDPTEESVKSFMILRYNLQGISSWTFRPSVKRGYKNIVNKQVLNPKSNP